MDFDSLPSDEVAQTQPVTPESSQAVPAAIPHSSQPMSFDSLADDAAKYETGEQQAITGVEGAAQGVLGPIAPLVERGLDISPHDIRGRAEANPITHGVGEAAGLVGSALTGIGEGAIMSKAGHLAADAVGLGEVAKGARLSYKIGSEAVKQAAEMAVLQGSDEVSKMILKDPESSAESAIANIGLATALGGAGGAAMGAVSPLWNATGGAALEKLLGGLHGHLNGGQLTMPENLAMAFKDLGHEPSPMMQAALSGDQKAVSAFQDLYRAEHPEVMSELQLLPKKLQESVTESLGVNLDDAAHFSNAQSGEAVRDKFIEQVDKEYGPIAKELDAQRAEANKIVLSDESRLNLADQLREASLGEKVGVNSPMFKEYEQVARQVLDKETVGGLDQISENLGKSARHHGNDPVLRSTLYDIKSMLDGFKNEHIEKAAIESAGKDGLKLSADAIAERRAAKASYGEYAKKYDALLDNLGMKGFSGTGTMKARLSDLTAEQILRKFSTKGDVTAQRYLSEAFPEIAQMVREHEAKTFLAPSVHDVVGETALDVKSLAKRLDNLKKGSPEHADWVVSPQAQQKIASAKAINDALSQLKAVKNSGTPAGMAKVFRHMGSSALSAVSLIAGHNPIGGYILGEAAQHLGKSIPEAIKLAMLKQMGSSQPIKAEGFKAMVDMMQQTIKGENMLAKSTKAVFKAGAQVTAERPDAHDRDKIDKAITKLQEAPGKTAQLAQGSHIGHYMPEHQMAVTQAQVRATQYLQGLKPHPYRPGPLDQEIPPSAEKIARYNRALDIAASPGVILQHIKDGTLQSSDIQDIHGMFPALAKNMAQKLSTEMTHAQEAGDIVPYRTKVALAMFLGQPIDTTMLPSSIIAAQPVANTQPPQPQGAKMKGGAKTATTMNKNAKSYQTGSQAAEADRNGRD